MLKVKKKMQFCTATNQCYVSGCVHFGIVFCDKLISILSELKITTEILLVKLDDLVPFFSSRLTVTIQYVTM